MHEDVAGMHEDFIQLNCLYKLRATSCEHASIDCGLTTKLPSAEDRE